MITEFGNAYIGDKGYYRISSKGENFGKFLHKLIWEKWYSKSVPEGYSIHHINGNKTDNRIQNLQCVNSKTHAKFHSSGRIHSESSMIKRSQKTNTTNFFRVTKHKRKEYKQNFIYSYRYWEDGKHKSLYSVNLNKLEQKVKEKGLPWKKLKEGGLNEKD